MISTLWPASSDMISNTMLLLPEEEEEECREGMKKKQFSETASGLKAWAAEKHIRREQEVNSKGRKKGESLASSISGQRQGKCWRCCMYIPDSSEFFRITWWKRFSVQIPSISNINNWL